MCNRSPRRRARARSAARVARQDEQRAARDGRAATPATTIGQRRGRRRRRGPARTRTRARRAAATLDGEPPLVGEEAADVAWPRRHGGRSSRSCGRVPRAERPSAAPGAPVLVQRGLAVGELLGVGRRRCVEDDEAVLWQLDLMPARARGRVHSTLHPRADEEVRRQQREVALMAPARDQERPAALVHAFSREFANCRSSRRPSARSPRAPSAPPAASRSAALERRPVAQHAGLLRSSARHRREQHPGHLAADQPGIGASPRGSPQRRHPDREPEAGEQRRVFLSSSRLAASRSLSGPARAKARPTRPGRAVWRTTASQHSSAARPPPGA